MKKNETPLWVRLLESQEEEKLRVRTNLKAGPRPGGGGGFPIVTHKYPSDDDDDPPVA